ncbi:DUF3597 domain-containing protein, partial [Desulfobulbus sp. US4]|nr:DUF3597 domain-containing protein [Desulfobulbus sp. US4]
MGFFNTILEKLGIGNEAVAAPIPTPAPAPTSNAEPAASPEPETIPTAPTPRSVDLVDVVAQLEQRAEANPQKLNWRTSIVDLLKLLEIDSSFTARKELATELDCPAAL